MHKSPTAIQGVHVRAFNPFGKPGVSKNPSHKKKGYKKKSLVAQSIRRVEVLRGAKIPFKAGTKEFRLSQELRRIVGTKISPSQSKADIYTVLASLRRSGNLRYLKKSDTFFGRDIEAVFKKLVEKKVIIYSPFGIKK